MVETGLPVGIVTTQPSRRVLFRLPELGAGLQSPMDLCERRRALLLPAG